MFCLDHSADQYYEKIASIQESIRKSEKRRLHLEGELFTHSMSDRTISQIKSTKLRSYLREICDREAQAKVRNLQLLRDVECMEFSMKAYRPDHGPLYQQKADCLSKISKLMAARRKKFEFETAMVKVDCARELQHTSPPDPAVHFEETPVIFTGCNTTKGSDTATMSEQPGQALHHSPICNVHSHEQPPSGPLKDFRVGGEDAGSNGAHLSDDISGSNDSPDGSNLSDTHEGTVAVLPSISSLTGAASNVSFRGDEQAPSPSVTLMAPQKHPLSPSNSPPSWVQNSPEGQADTGKEVHQLPIMAEEQSHCSHLILEKPSERESQEKPGSCEAVGLPTSGLRSESSASDLSISMTESESEDDFVGEDSAGKCTDLPETSAIPDGGDDKHRPNNPGLIVDTVGSEESLQSKCDSPASGITSQRLSQEGLLYLLDSIEGRLHSEHTTVYRVSSIEGNQLSRIISLCNSGESLNGEDLESCGAVVIHGLQMLSWSTAKGCLLPEELVIAHQSSPEPKDISASLPPDAAQLWDRWFKHALLLKQRHLLSTEHLIQLFTPVLLQRHATHGPQAKMLLRTLLSRSSEECPSPEEESALSSTCDPPSLLADGGHLESDSRVQIQQHQGLQSTEEDSQEESPMESIPIRETKAYQLLKQSAMQERLQSSGEEEEEDKKPTGINQECEEDLGRAKLSPHQDPYPRTGRTDSKAHSILQSKAFWGESEDSISEIEAALRPQPFNNDDSDDFYS